MFTLDELSQKVSQYQNGGSFLEFADWFEDNCAGAYDNAEVRAACIAVDAALSEYYYDHVGENVLKQELEKAVRPFPLRTESLTIKRPLGEVLFRYIEGRSANQVRRTRKSDSNLVLVVVQSGTSGNSEGIPLRRPAGSASELLELAAQQA